MQTCPANANAPNASRSAASSRSASGSTSTAALPPSSSVIFLRGLSRLSCQPTSSEPVNVIPRTRPSAAMRAARSPDTGSTLIAPAGQSSSASSSASASDDSGVALAGLTMTGLPTASAGATLCATRFSGKLNGVIASTGPIGKRRSNPPRLPIPGSVSNGSQLPSIRLACSPAQRKTYFARVASPIASLIGLPASSEIVRASASICSPIRADAASRRSERSHAGIAASSPAAAAAASSATCTPSLSGTAASPTTEPS